MTDAPPLLPCPFCGSTTAPQIVSNGIGDFYVRCVEDEDTGDGCGARTSDYRAEVRSIAAARWNRRDGAQFPAVLTLPPEQTPTNLGELDAMRARAIAAAQWEYPTRREVADAFPLARAIREVDTAAGVMSVPVEPTAGMVAADGPHKEGWIIRDADEWKAILAASPFAPQVPK